MGVDAPSSRVTVMPCCKTRDAAGCACPLWTRKRVQAEEYDNTAACTVASVRLLRGCSLQQFSFAPLWLWQWTARREHLRETCCPAQRHASAPMTARTARCDRDVGRGPPITSRAPQVVILDPPSLQQPLSGGLGGRLRSPSEHSEQHERLQRFRRTSLLTWRGSQPDVAVRGAEFSSL